MQTDEYRERIVAALEKLASDPVVEIDAGPPICPHCGKHDPVVTIPESQSTGRLSEFVIQASCSECGEMMYAIIESFSMHRTVETLKEEFQLRRAGSNGQDV